MGGEAKFFALYTRKAGWATAVAALYSIGGAAVNFKPNLEIRDVHFADPLAPPDSCPPATLHRLQELTGAAPSSHYW